MFNKQTHNFWLNIIQIYQMHGTRSINFIGPQQEIIIKTLRTGDADLRF